MPSCASVIVACHDRKRPGAAPGPRRSVVASLRDQRPARIEPPASPQSTCRRFLPSYGVGRNGKFFAIPLAVMSVPTTPGAPAEEVDAVAGLRADVVQPAHDADRDVGDVVVRTPPVRPTRLVGASAPRPAALAFGRGGIDSQSRAAAAPSTALPQFEPLSAWPGYLSRMLIRSVRFDAGEPSSGTTGTP